MPTARERTFPCSTTHIGSPLSAPCCSYISRRCTKCSRTSDPCCTSLVTCRALRRPVFLQFVRYTASTTCDAPFVPPGLLRYLPLSHILHRIDLSCPDRSRLDTKCIRYYRYLQRTNPGAIYAVFRFVLTPAETLALPTLCANRRASMHPGIVR